MRTTAVGVVFTFVLIGCSSSAVAPVGGGGAGGGVDNNTNKATLSGSDDSGQQVSINRNKPASEADAVQKVLGANNAGELLNLYVTTSQGLALVMYIDTAVHPLPAKGIPAGAPNSSAWVTYSNAGPFLNSNGSGTIDIDTCPLKDGLAVVGRLNNVKVVNELPVGPAEITLSGPFNLVYYGGAGALNCKPKDDGGGTSGGGTSSGGTSGGGTSGGGTSGGGTSGGGTSGGGTSGGGSGGGDTAFDIPAGSTCDADPCDGGTNTTRNCCPWLPCLSDCWFKCALTAQSCVQGCGFDIGCLSGCAESAATCRESCPASCQVNAACGTALGGLDKCMMNNTDACETADDEDACIADACCSEHKAAF